LTMPTCDISSFTCIDCSIRPRNAHPGIDGKRFADVVGQA
jgi:hypothetical protein